jgi:hypothetical protein
MQYDLDYATFYSTFSLPGLRFAVHFFAPCYFSTSACCESLLKLHSKSYDAIRVKQAMRIEVSIAASERAQDHTEIFDGNVSDLERIPPNISRILLDMVYPVHLLPFLKFFLPRSSISLHS